MKNSKIKNCFYTGGWDSTYMILKYLKNGYTVKPIYVLDHNRKSYIKEKQTIIEILDLVKNTTPYKNNIMDVDFIDLSNVIVDDNIKNSYETIKSKVFIGSQYKWLSEISKKYSSVSIGIEKPSGEYSGCVEAINSFGALKKDNEELIIDREKSSFELISLMGNFVFPIIEMTEVEMIDDIRKWKYECIMEHIWFCHSPIHNTPCGMCRPCEQKMQCQMDFLLPKKSQKRYYRLRRIKKIFGKKIGNFYSKMIIKMNK